MRDILYRGKTIHELPKNKWVFGYLCNKDYISCPESGNGYPVDPETVCQYTGSISSILTGGNKIFEQDIVDIDGVIGVVKFGKYGNGFHTGFYIEWVNSEFRQEIGFWDGKVKVIGNIFDNSELLKGDTK